MSYFKFFDFNLDLNKFYFLIEHQFTYAPIRNRLFLKSCGIYTKEGSESSK